MGILAGLALLCILVVVHEFGHFIVAKLLGVRVLTFSVGFGPKLIGFKRGDTEYRISAIPLGGYVKMLGESPTEELAVGDQKSSFLHQALWKKSLIALAGPLFNFALPIVVFFFLFVGSESILKPVVGTVIPGEVAAQAGLQAGDQIRSVDGRRVDSFNDLVEQISARPNQATKLELRRDGQNLSIVVTPHAESSQNPLSPDEKVGRIGVMPALQKPIIVVPHPQSVAAKAGLQNFDEIMAIDGKSISSFEELRRQDSSKSVKLSVRRDGKLLEIVLPATTEKVSFVQEPKLTRFAVTQDEIDTPEFQQQFILANKELERAGSELNATRGIAFADAAIVGVEALSSAAELKLQRGDRFVSVDGKPVSTWMQAQRQWQMKPDAWHVAGIQRNGQSQVIAFRLKGVAQKTFGQKEMELYTSGPTQERSVSVVEATKRAFNQTGELVVMTVQSLWMLVSGQVPASELGGPIMIMGVAGQAAAQGLAYYLYVLSLISVNLGLLNLLPIPILDGGHLFLFGIEAIIRRPLSLRARQFAMQLGLGFVLCMMALAIFNDLSRLFS